MKRNIVVGAILTVIAAGGTGVWAGAGGGLETPDKGGACRCQEPEKRMPPLPSPEGMIDHLSCLLELSGDQQAKMKALLESNKAREAQLRRKEDDSRKKLRAALNASTYDEAEVKNAVSGQAQVEVERVVSHARLRNQINSLLTPEQRGCVDRLLPPPPLGDHGSHAMGGDKRGHMRMPPPPCMAQRPHYPDTGYYK